MAIAVDLSVDAEHQRLEAASAGLAAATRLPMVTALSAAAAASGRLKFCEAGMEGVLSEQGWTLPQECDNFAHISTI